MLYPCLVKAAKLAPAGPGSTRPIAVATGPATWPAGAHVRSSVGARDHGSKSCVGRHQPMRRPRALALYPPVNYPTAACLFSSENSNRCLSMSAHHSHWWSLYCRRSGFPNDGQSFCLLISKYAIPYVCLRILGDSRIQIHALPAAQTRNTLHSHSHTHYLG
jgi:hypothetical protein